MKGTVSTLLAAVLAASLPASALAQFAQHGAGAAGWLHCGAFHPTDADVLVIGADVSGVSRSDDFGKSWYTWNEGLPTDHEVPSDYIEDLLGVAGGNFSGFFAATRGGLFRARDDGAWQWLTEPPAYAYDSTESWRAEIIPFCSLDVNLEGDLLVAGAGNTRWGKQAEFESYPGLPDGTFVPWPQGPSEQWSVWAMDPGDPQALPTPLGDCRFKTARAVACRKLDGQDHVVAGTPEGIFVHDGQGWQSIYDASAGAGLDCWGLALTQRGTLYAAMARLSGSLLPTGLYRIADIRSVAPSWEWVGDSTLLPPR